MDEIYIAQDMIEEIAPIELPPAEEHNLTGFVLYSAQWCTPCKVLKPSILKYINFIMDLSEGNPTSVRSVPTVKAFIDGHQIGELVGPTKQQVKEFYETHIDAIMAATHDEYVHDLDNSDIVEAQEDK